MIDKMNLHYSFTNPASVYDEEALTALELAGRQGAKINEVVDDQNKLRNETENHLSKQDDFIEKMNDETLPANVTAEVQEQIENGTFDNAINEYAGDLIARLNNLLGSVTEGSTTMDAEVIDARKGINTTYTTLGEAIRTQIENTLHYMGTLTSGTYATRLSDANNAKPNSIYCLNFGTDAELPANLPATINNFGGGIMHLITLTGGTSYRTQLLVTIAGKIYMRYYAASWVSWRDLTDDTQTFKHIKTIHAGNYSTLLPDVNNAKPYSVYCVNIGEGGSVPDNLPWKTSPTGLFYLITIDSMSSYATQFIITLKNNFYVRHKAGSWLGWTNITPQTDGVRRVMTVGSGGDFTKLTDAMAYARTESNLKIIVGAGTYDIVEELGDEYFANYTGYEDSNYMNLGNNTEWVFSPNSKVVCHYTGGNTNIDAYFSPFNSLAGSCGSFILDGLVLEVSGCRYAIHDDIGGTTTQETHIYKNCHITGNRRRAIGAGFGANTHVEIIDCVFDNNNNNEPSVSWHNSFVDGRKTIVVRGCVFKGMGNTLWLRHYGNYETKSQALVSGNKFNIEPSLSFENDTATYENIELISFNNIIETT